MGMREIKRRLDRLEARKSPEVPEIILVGIGRDERGEWAEVSRCRMANGALDVAAMETDTLQTLLAARRAAMKPV